MPGVKDGLISLADNITVHVLTADTFGQARSFLKGIHCEFSVIANANQDLAKLEYIRGLDAGKTVCIGNGRNDYLMLKEAGLGIAVILQEGAAAQTLLSADVVCTSIVSALDLLRNPLRLTATLRS